MKNEKVWKLSWVSYVKAFFFLPLGTIFIAFILMIIFSFALAFISGYLSPETIASMENLPTRLGVSENMIVVYIGLVVWGIVTVIIGIFVFFSMRKIMFYYDNEGVWFSSGILPWRKGVNGIKWRDLDEALYSSGFLGWAFNSYYVVISHRFTKGVEISMKDIKYGNIFVQEVNEAHQKHIENNHLDVWFIWAYKKLQYS